MLSTGSAQCIEDNCRTISLWRPEPDRSAWLNPRSPSWETATEDLLKTHTTTPVHVLLKRAESVVYTTLTPYPIAERILIPQLYALNKYPCTVNRDLRRQSQYVTKLDTQETNGIIPNIEPSSLTWSSSNYLQKLWDLVACSSSYHSTVRTQSVYNKHKISTYQSYIAPQTRHSLPVVLQATVGDTPYNPLTIAPQCSAYTVFSQKRAYSQKSAHPLLLAQFLV